MRFLSSIGFVFLLLAGANASAQQNMPQYPRPYDGFQAGEDAARYQNDRRILALNQQLGVVDYYRAWAGVSRYQGYGIWRQDMPVDPWGNPVGPYDSWFGPSLFSGPFPATGTVRQPINQVQIQTGPNRWESHPVYESPPGLPPQPDFSPALPQEQSVRSREF